MNRTVTMDRIAYRAASLAAFAVVVAASHGPVAAQTAAATNDTPAPPRVAAAAFSSIAIYPRREAAATTVSLNESKLSAEVNALVVALPVEVGQTVPRGAVVARLDPRDFELAVNRSRAALESSRARLSLADQQLRRARELAQQNFISQEAVANRETEAAVARADLAQNEAQLATAQRNLAKTTIVAPFRAIVKARTAQLGELAAPGTPLLTLVDAERIQVSAAVQTRDAATLAAAKELAFETTAGQVLAVRMIRIAPAVTRESQSQEARLAFVSTMALPGTEGKLAWRDARAHVPADYLVRRDGRLGVFVVKDSTATFVPIDDAQEGRPALAPFGADTAIVTDGRQTLRNGQRLSQTSADATKR